MSRGGDIASSTLLTASAAANAVPVWGQFASAGLAIAGGLAKIFGNIDGPRKKKKRRAQQARTKMQSRNQGLAQRGAQAGTQGAGGQLQTGGQMPMQPMTVQSVEPATPMYNPAPQTLNGQ